MIFADIAKKDPAGDRHVFRTDGQGTLCSYEGPGGEVTVPAGISCIGKDAFAFCSQVTSVTLPKGVLRIEERAFFKSGIRAVFLPETLTRIEERAFSETPLESIEIPSKVTDIKDEAFSGAKHLTHVELPEEITSLEPGVFRDCISLKEIVLPRKVKYIQGRAFMNCAALERAVLPENLVCVWVYAFEGCSSLREIRLGDRLEAIGDAAFKGCTALKKVRIPGELEQVGENAFDEGVEITGPGVKNGLIVIDNEIKYCCPGLKTVIIPEGVTDIGENDLDSLIAPEVLDLPKSLKYYSWKTFAQFESLRQIVTDRDALAAEIALLLDIECVDREGRRFTYQAPQSGGEWIFNEDRGRNGIRLLGCRGRIGHTGSAEFTTVVLPDKIDGRPVTCIGPYAFDGYDAADAFYIPDSVQRIEDYAFGHNGYIWDKLFVRIPENASLGVNAFEGTNFYTRADACLAREKDRTQKKPKNVAETDAADPAGNGETDFAETAADDPAIGTGTVGRPALSPNIWQYFDRLSREERVRELTHSFKVSGDIDGIGWASIWINLDGGSADFRISYIGSSPADLKRFAAGIEDGEIDSFAWVSEPGSYPWNIQRRDGIFYVVPPVIEKGFFISRDEFLYTIRDLDGSW